MKLFFIFLAIFLYGYDFYVPLKYKGVLPEKFNIKKYVSLNDINFSNSFVLLSTDYLPYILENNFTILTPIGVKNEYILSNVPSLSKIRTISKLNLPSFLLLNAVNSDFKEVNATLKDFINKKVDAIVVKNKKILEMGDYFYFDIQKYGIFFNEYLIVYKNFDDVKKLKKFNLKFEKIFDFKEDLVYKSLVLMSYFLNKKLDFNKVLFENYTIEKEKDKLKVLVTPNWPPFDIYEKGVLKGIGVDFFKIIAKKAKLKYSMVIVDYWPNVLEMIKEKKADLTPSTSETKERKQYALFSKPYYSFPLGIVCNTNSEINSFKKVKKIAVGKDYTAEKLMKKYYPNLEYIEVKNIFEALKLVQKNKDVCAVDMLPVLLWNIEKNSMYNLNLIYQTPFKFNLQIMVRNDRPDIIKKINMAIDSLTPEEKRTIVNRYIGGILNQKKSTLNYFLIVIWVIIFFGAFLIALKYRKKSLTDELTGILNRRGIIKQSKKVSTKSSLLFFDIDHFKKINDTYGHEFGDYVLKALSELISKNIRNTDIFGRWGGEEFVLILRGTSFDRALKVAEKLRLIVANYDFKGKKVTISIGVAPFDKDLYEALAKADEAMYEAKKSGRNQVKGKK